MMRRSVDRVLASRAMLALLVFCLVAEIVSVAWALVDDHVGVAGHRALVALPIAIAVMECRRRRRDP